MSEPESDGREEVRISLVESNEALRRDLASALSRSGFRVDATADAFEARRWAAGRRSRVRVLDLQAPGVRSWLEDASFEGVTLLLAADDVRLDARRSIDVRDLEILYKPFPFERLESWILSRLRTDEGRAVALQDPMLETQEPALQALFERACRLARRSLPTSLIGEIGTGRRALARRMHAWSPRHALPWVLLERSLLESRGAGRSAEILDEALAQAGRGTLVLVEPAEQPMPVQQALRSALRRTADGGPGWLAIARQPLERSVGEGTLLLELQYHLEVTSLSLPALRERRLDQAALCETIAGRVARDLGQPPPAMDAELVAVLARDGFPGNRMGLESRLRGLLMQSTGGPAALRALATGESTRVDAAAELPRLDLKSLERDTIIRALAHWDGNRTRASESLGISVRTLRNKIREYDLR